MVDLEGHVVHRVDVAVPLAQVLHRDGRHSPTLPCPDPTQRSLKSVRPPANSIGPSPGDDRRDHRDGAREHVPHRSQRDDSSESKQTVRPLATPVAGTHRRQRSRRLLQLSGAGPCLRGQHHRKRRLPRVRPRGGEGVLDTRLDRSTVFVRPRGGDRRASVVQHGSAPGPAVEHVHDDPGLLRRHRGRTGRGRAARRSPLGSDTA